MKVDDEVVVDIYSLREQYKRKRVEILKGVSSLGSS